MPIDPSFWSGRSVMVTGHTGFKGAWLSLWLASLGARPCGLAPAPPTRPSLFEAARVGVDVPTRAVDVRDADAVAAAVAAERPEVVFHLAAQPMVRRSLRDPLATYELNVMGTVNVLDAVRACEHVRAVVIVTSDKCYANPPDRPRRPFVESDPMGGRDPYSSSKACAELVAGAYRNSFFSGPGAARLATARAGNVIGGGDWGEDRLIPDVIRAAEAGAAVRLRNPDAVRPWQHVLNPLSGYLLVAQALVAGQEADQAWNFGPDADDARAVRWVADVLAELWPGGLDWQRDEGQNPPEADFLALDSSKAKRCLGWRPVWNLEEALRRTVEWHDAQRRGSDMREVSLGQLHDFGARERT